MSPVQHVSWRRVDIPCYVRDRRLFVLVYSHFPASGHAVVSGVVPSPPRYVPSIFIAHGAQHSYCPSIFIECYELTLSRFPRVKLCTRKKVPTNLYEYALGGTRTHAIELRGNIAGTRMTCYTTGATVFFLIHHVRLTTPGRYYIIFMARRTA